MFANEPLPRRLFTALLCTCLSVGNAVTYAASFEQSCRSEFFSANVDIVFESTAPTVDQSKSAHELARLVKPGAGYRQIGLTQALLQREFAVSLNGFVDPLSGRACGKPAIEIRLRYDPTRIYLASELDVSECAQEQVLDHELDHVKLYASAVDRAAFQLRHDILARYRGIVLRGTEQQILQDVEREIRERWLPGLDSLLDQSETHHDTLDRAADARISNACNGDFAEVLRRVEASRPEE